MFCNSVSVKFNVNHTVDADEPEEFSEDKNQEKERAENEEDDNIKSKPNFEVDIVRNGTTLSFTCTFLNGVPAEDEYGKLFCKIASPFFLICIFKILLFLQTMHSASKSWPFIKGNSVVTKCTHVPVMYSMATCMIWWWISWKREALPMNSVPNWLS